MIVLDPGHGGARPDRRPGIDRGARAGGVNEDQLALVYTSALLCALAARGVAASSTRLGDAEGLTLSDRAAIANSKGARAFVSLHCNASDSVLAQGFQVFYARGSTRGEQLARAVFAAAVPAAMPVTTRTGVFPDQTIHCGYTSAANAYLQKLPPAVRGDWKQADRLARKRFGEHDAYRSLAVLRQTAMPAILVELDFLTCPAALARLQDAAHRAALCGRIADGIHAWLA